MDRLEDHIYSCLRQSPTDMAQRSSIGRIIGQWIYDLPSRTSRICSVAAFNSPKSQCTLDHPFGRQFVGETVYDMAHEGVDKNSIMGYVIDQTVVYAVTKKENIFLRDFQKQPYKHHRDVYKAASIPMMEGKPIFAVDDIVYHIPKSEVAKILGLSVSALDTRFKSKKTKWDNYQMVLPQRHITVM